MNTIPRPLMRLAVVAAALAATQMATAGSVEIPVQIGGTMSVPVTSLKEVKFKRTVHQQFDFSCGSAALATLLTFHFGTPVDERTAFDEMYRHGDPQKIRREGFSLLDMKNYLSSMGFESDGFEAPLDSLAEAQVAAIVLVNERGYNHFVVVKGLQPARVLIGDPASGTRAVGRAAFDAMWTNKILFVIPNRPDLALFNQAADWAAAPRAPLSQQADSGASRVADWARLGKSDF